MTKKRFTSNNGVFYTDNETGWEFQCYGEVVDLLNELNEEVIELNNECAKHLSDKIKDYEQFKECADNCKELHEENQLLKEENENLEHTREFCAECCERLEKENEQLKSEIKEVRGAYEQLWMRL